jgi:hypothetical protein
MHVRLLGMDIKQESKIYTRPTFFLGEYTRSALAWICVIYHHTVPCNPNIEKKTVRANSGTIVFIIAKYYSTFDINHTNRKA